MPISTKALRGHIERQDLISLQRAMIDDHSIQGFILDCSETLILLQYVYDFHLDGFMLLRRRDISELSSSDTDRFQRQLLSTDGVLQHVDFTYRAPIESFDTFLASRSPKEIILVEDEMSKPDRFLIGSVSRVADGTATIRHFTGVARLVEPPEDIAADQITSCQTCTHYIRFYERHFERALQLH